MKVRVQRSILSKALQVVEAGVNERSTLPILSHVLLQASKGQLYLSTTDLDLGIRCVVPVEVQEEGAVTVPAKRLGDIIKELPEEEVSLQVRKNNMVTIDCQHCFFRLLGFPQDEFPKLPTIQQEPDVRLPQATLRTLLQLTAFAMSNEESRYVLNGALFVFEGQVATVVATDGRRLSVASHPVTNKPTQKRLIVPAKTIYELLRLAKDEGEVAISFLGENQVAFQQDQTTLISRLVEGEFPNYEKVIPPPAKDKVAVPREAILAAVRRAHLLTTANAQSVCLELARDRLTISKETQDVGAVREELGVRYAGGEFAVHFNPVYLLDIFKAMREEEVALELVAPDKPMVVRGEGYTYIVLPMQPT